MTEGSGSTLNNTGSTAGGDLTTSGSPTWSAAGLSFAPTNSYAFGSFASTALSDFSMYCVLKWDIGQAVGTFPFASAFCGNYPNGPRMGVQAQANMGRVETGVVNNPIGTSGIVGSGMCSIVDGKWHVLAMTRSGTTVTTYLDDVVVATETAGGLAGPQTVDFLQWGSDAPGSINTCPATCGYMALYDTAHTKAQVRSQRVSFASIMSGRGESMPVLNPFFILEGDSMMEYSYNFLYQSALIDGMAGVNLAVAGSTVASMTARAAAADDYVAVAKANSVMVVLVTNDLASGPAATYVADLKTYCLARRAAGVAHIIVCTVTPRDNPPTQAFNVTRNEANTLIRADTSFYDSLLDLGAHNLLGPDGAPAEGVYYDDSVHFNNAGKEIQVPLILGAVRAAIDLNGHWLMEDGSSAWLKEDGTQWLIEF